jgi:hypothetical protein
MSEINLKDWTGESGNFGKPISDENREEIMEFINNE